MFKLFWVWQDDSDKELDDSMELDISESQEEFLEDEIGQIALDVLEWPNEVYIVAPIAWVEYEDLDLTINKTVLTIKWTREKIQEYYIDDVIIRNSECFWWKFSRNIILPENLALNKIKAYMQNNLLVIWIPKLKYDSKSIKINKIES